MESLCLIINLAAELAKLAGTIVADVMQFIALLARACSALAHDQLLMSTDKLCANVAYVWLYG